MSSTQEKMPPNATNKDELVLFEGGSGGPIRMVGIVALAFALGSFLLAFALMNNDNQLGNQVSSTERTVWAGGILVALVGFFAATTMYRRRVASKISLIDGGKMLRIETPTLLGTETNEVPLRDLELSRFHEGDKAGEDAMATPWLHLQIKGQRSFVVPLSGKIPNRERLLQVLGATR